MMRSTCLALLMLGGLLLGASGPAADPEKKGSGTPPVPEDGPKVIRLAAQARRLPLNVMAHSLLLDSADQVNGNAAPLWIRAGMAARSVRYKWTQAEWNWESPDTTPLTKLPRKPIKDLLDQHATALRLAEQAALRTRCDWDHPPVTIQTLGDLPFDDIQMNRQITQLISLRCRLELAEGRLDDARRSLRIGLRLARQVGHSDTLVQDLVGIALAQIMLGRIDEWIALPGSPNLYWALTELPRPLVGVHRSIRSELNMIYHSFPSLRELKSRKLDASEAQTLVKKVFQAFAKLGGEDDPTPWKIDLATTALALKYYPVARKGLIARGRSEKEVEALPVVQAVVLDYLEEYDRVRDEFLKWLAVPGHQGFAELARVEQVERKKGRDNGNVVITLLMPALVKAYGAQLRLERNVAGLRAAEALRLHVARHGKPPAKWADLTEVPAPIDPYTGRGFDAWYSVKDGKAILEIPPPPGESKRLGKRYEITFTDR